MFLKKGDVVGIVAPAGFIRKEEDIKQAINLIKSWGLQVKLAKNLFIKESHFAGNDSIRKNDFQIFLDDEKIKAIWCVRGGYGSIRIIDKLDFTKFKRNPKWIIGYSDITVFHQAIHNLGFESVHSFMPTSMKTFKNNGKPIQHFKNLLFGKNISYHIHSNKNNRLGKVTGKIIGGNLSVMSSLLGTNYTIQPKNHILFIEEIGEYKYSIDRMLHSLKLNGYFKKCNGLIIGNFTNIKINDPLFGQTIEEIVLNVVSEYNFPVCFDFPAGHITNNNPIIFGRKVILDVTDKNVTLNYNVKH